jgi:hypothetical protein
MRGSELLLRKKAVFVPLLKRNIVLSVVLKAPRTQHNVSKAARLASIDRNYLYRDEEARHRPQRVKRA